ncbi:polysaccharide lyase 8 family protein [Serratia rubidaea]|nr:polysaccharide lyase 8 family protein [Serratia rubidaea]
MKNSRSQKKSRTLTKGATALFSSIDRDIDEYGQLRNKWTQLRLGYDFEPSNEPFKSLLTSLGVEASKLMNTMTPNKNSLWPDLKYFSNSTTSYGTYNASAAVSGSFTRLFTMAQAYVYQCTGLTENEKLRTMIIDGLEHVYVTVYNEKQAAYGNWYSWKIGSPQAMLDTCVLMYDFLTPMQIAKFCAAVDHFVPNSVVSSYKGTSTGANRVDLCRVLLLRGMVGGDPAKLQLASKALSPVFPYVIDGDGFYVDGSFIQHGHVPYTGHYGAVLLNGLSLILATLTGSNWAVTDRNRQILFDAVEKAWAPFIYNGLAMDCVAGRAISFQHENDHSRGYDIIASIAVLGLAASETENARWRGLIKGWMIRDLYNPLFSGRGANIAQLAQLKPIMNDRTIRPVAEPVAHRIFPRMARTTHRRPGWAAALSMANARVSYYETGNGDNLHGWHTGSGMLYWWGDFFGNDQYSDNFWPTVDPYRLPGITVSHKVLADGAGGSFGKPRPKTTWAGGATDGEWAVICQHLKGLESTLQANKVWFFLDDVIVCLGADISCRDGVRVESIVENRKLSTIRQQGFFVDGMAQPDDVPWSATQVESTWAHLDGAGGYIFPGGATINALREERSGRWRDIDQGGDTLSISRQYLTLWFDHGIDPSSHSYVYILMPSASMAQTCTRAADTSWLSILENNVNQQGINVPSLGFMAVNFWSSGTVDTLSADGPCCVMVREMGDGTAVICVSDPTWQQRSSLTVIWLRAVQSVISQSANVTHVTVGSSLKLNFGALGSSRGISQIITVRMA